MSVKVESLNIADVTSYLSLNNQNNTSSFICEMWKRCTLGNFTPVISFRFHMQMGLKVQSGGGVGMGAPAFHVIKGNTFIGFPLVSELDG